jgi:hypothetical protein
MAKTISFDRFDFGLDLRKGASTSDANRLRVLKNAYTTEGRTIRKRPGLTKIATLEAGTTGLFAGNGKLNTFYGGTGTITHANALFQSHNTRSPTTPALAISKVHYGDVFNGFMYSAIEYTTGEIKHHYLDGAAPGATHITDANCPHTKQVIKISSKIWAIGTNGDTVRFCKTNAPRDWTTANDAGFLPVGLQQSGANQATALGFYTNRLVVFFADSSQVWQVDVDPAKHSFLQAVDVGSILPYSHSNMSGDVFFLSPAGVRTITRQDVTTNLIDADVGSPIDRDLLDGDFIVLANAKSQYYRGGGQYWLYSGNKAMVYTFSRTSGVSAWSLYEFPYSIDYMDELNAELYMRSGDNVYKLDRSVKTDDGTNYSVDIELAYLDFKAPGVLKHIYAMDSVVTGSCEISHRFDPRDTALVTNPAVTITGDTRPGYLYPVELLVTSLAPVLRNYDDQDFELHQLMYYFDNLAAI